nr:hypothetical protein [Tanacetum cinerariifolium]
MEQPPGFIDPRLPNHVCRLKKALYEPKQVPRSMFQRLSSFLVGLGFSCSRADTSLFIFKKEFSLLYVLVYVDDIILTGNQPSLLRHFITRLNAEFSITDLDLSYVVNQVSQFLHALMKDHFQAVKRILRYVKSTLSYGLSFSHGTSPSILGYSNADWACCIEKRRLIYGYSIFLDGNQVSWSAKKQPTVTQSSCESEYRALANSASEIIWITHLLRELHVLPSGRPTLLCDNRSALFLSQNPISHKRAKHIDIDYHFVWEMVMSRKLHTKFLSSHIQLADIFTKSLPRPLFKDF